MMMQCLCEPCGCCPQLTQEKKRNTTHLCFVCVVSDVFVMKGSHSAFPSSTQTQVHTRRAVNEAKLPPKCIGTVCASPLSSLLVFSSPTPLPPNTHPSFFFFFGECLPNLLPVYRWSISVSLRQHTPRLCKQVSV